MGGGSEEDAFWVLHFLIEHVLPPAFFGELPSQKLPQLRGLQRALAVVTRLIEQRQPALANHLEDLGVPVSCIAVRWLPCLFAGAMPMEVVLRVWDMVLTEGMVAIYRAIVAIFEMSQVELLAAHDVEHVAALTHGKITQLEVEKFSSWMHSSWPWMPSLMSAPDPKQQLWSDIRTAEQIAEEEVQMNASHAASDQLQANEMSFLEKSL